MIARTSASMRRPRRAPLKAARGGAVIIAVTALTVLAACSGSPSSAGTSGSARAAPPARSASAVAYSQCMRAHGVPGFPDPDPRTGEVPKGSAQQLGVSSSRLQAAEGACQNLYPDSGRSGGVLTKDSIGQCEQTGECPQALVQQAMAALRAYARCMRSHGVPNWPDPTIDSEGRPEVNLVPITGTDWNSPQISNIMHECERVMPNGIPVPVIAPGAPG